MILPNGHDDLVLRTDEPQQPIPTTDEELTIQSLRRWARSEHKRERGVNAYTLHQAAITLERVTTERDQLRAAVEDAYFEGYRDGERRDARGVLNDWRNSDACAALSQTTVKEPSNNPVKNDSNPRKTVTGGSDE